jgi:hypothetical protein
VSDHARVQEHEAARSTMVLSRNDRFSELIVVLLVAFSVAVGLLLRQQTSGQLWTYQSTEAGVEVEYPAGWLVDESGSYLARIRDPKARPFKTQYQITIIPAGGQTSIRNVLDGLTLQRSINLSAYRVLSVQNASLGGQTVTQMDFAFVDADPNPFIQRLPVVVLGEDIVIRDGDRAIVLSYMADENTFNSGLPGFQRFLASLRY